MHSKLHRSFRAGFTPESFESEVRFLLHGGYEVLRKKVATEPDDE